MPPRLLIITTDIGGDPDDQQSLTRLPIYANEFRIEGRIATASDVPDEKTDASPRPDLIYAHPDAYAEVLPSLRRHADSWLEADELRRVVKRGRALRGLDAAGDSGDTEASDWIVRQVDAGTPADPLNVSIWAGQTDPAQALRRVRETLGAEGIAAFVVRLRI